MATSSRDDEALLIALKASLGIKPVQRPTTDFSETILVTKRVPCLGRLHIVQDRTGALMLLGIVVYWIYGMWSSYYVIIMPHYEDGYVPDWALYYHLVVAFLCLYSLFRSSTLNPGRVPLVDEAYAESQGWEVCPHCGRLRPSRAHHCSRCKQCVVRMDHHCPWINNCVGEANFHIFLLLLLYAMLFGWNTFVALMLKFWYWPPCVQCDQESFPIKHGIWFQYISFVMSITMALFMMGQLATHHMNVVLNRTTLESMTSKTPRLDISHIKSIYGGYSEIFGTRVMFLWFLPCRRRKSRIMSGTIMA